MHFRGRFLVRVHVCAEAGDFFVCIEVQQRQPVWLNLGL